MKFRQPAPDLAIHPHETPGALRLAACAAAPCTEWAFPNRIGNETSGVFYVSLAPSRFMG